MAREYRKNEVKVDIASYMHYWRGIKKIGKSTAFRDIIIEAYGDTKYGLLVEIGEESGHKALSDVYFDEATNWKTFREINDDLVKNKKDNEFKIICWDTVDKLVDIAINEVLRLHLVKKASPAESLNAALGGYGAGRAKATELIEGEIARIRRAGYGLIVIGHTKIKDIKEKTGEEYQQLASSLNADYDAIFANIADIVMTISTDKSIETKEIGEKTVGTLTGVTRYMHFRDNGYIDCGSRFNSMPDKVEFGVKNYLDAFKQGVLGAMVKPITEKELEKRQKDEVAEVQARANEYIENVNSEKDILWLVEEAKTLYKDCTDNKKKTKAAKVITGKGKANMSELEVSDIEQIIKILS